MLRLAVVSVHLILMLFVSQAAVVVGARLVYRGEVQDPLAPYAAIMPGQPIENLEQFSCNWYSEYFQDGMIGVCRTDSDAALHSVNVSVDNFAIQSLTFDVSDLTIGDLARLWGRPIIGTITGSYSARWDRGGYIVTVPLSRRFSYWLPVRHIYVIGGD